MTKQLSEREKAALLYQIHFNVKDWREIYIIATDQPTEEARKDINLSVYASKWKASEKVQTFVQEITELNAEREKERIIDQVLREGESVRKKREKNGFVDYSNPENQRKKLNELVNSASDPSEALDALKVIISGQRDDRQAAKEQRQVRAYLPITCETCPLYIKAKKRG